MRKILKTTFINIAVLLASIASLELVAGFAFWVKDNRSYTKNLISADIKRGKPIPTRWAQVFHPGVGHSHQLHEFETNPNTFDKSFDNLSSTEVYGLDKNLSSQVNILILGGSTTDPLGTQFSGYRGTWVHHLFDDLVDSSQLRFLVDNAGNGGSTSSNELLRLITKLHSSKYDLIVSLNGINEIYFSDNPGFKNKDNVLASSMLLYGINMGTIRAKDGGVFSRRGDFLKSSHLYLATQKIRATFLANIRRNSGQTINQKLDLSNQQKEMLSYGADVWEKNIRLMHSASNSMDSKYLAVLQPTLGLANDYCSSFEKACLLDSDEYAAKIRYLYSIMRDRCHAMHFCLDISTDRALTFDDSLYTDPRHPNSDGNRRIAQLVRPRIARVLGITKR